MIESQRLPGGRQGELQEAAAGRMGLQGGTKKFGVVIIQALP